MGAVVKRKKQSLAPAIKEHAGDICFLVGIVSLIVGIGMFSVPAALIILGLILIMFGFDFSRLQIKGRQ